MDYERQLISDLRARDEAAFERLVRERAGRLLAVARRIVSSEEGARDAVQEALSAFRAFDRFEGASGLGTWLHRITVNAALVRLRRLRPPGRAAAPRPVGQRVTGRARAVSNREPGHAA